MNSVCTLFISYPTLWSSRVRETRLAGMLVPTSLTDSNLILPIQWHTYKYNCWNVFILRSKFCMWWFVSVDNSGQMNVQYWWCCNWNKLALLEQSSACLWYLFRRKRVCTCNVMRRLTTLADEHIYVPMPSAHSQQQQQSSRFTNTAVYLVK